jgi:hypothetical protein
MNLRDSLRLYTSSLIDIILTNTPENISTSGVLHIGISDHSLVYTVRKFKLPKFRPTVKEVRDFKYFSDTQFRSDLAISGTLGYDSEI